MYQWRKGIAKWVVGNNLYISVPFTWLVDEANILASQWKGKVFLGGPGLMMPSTCDGFEPILFHNPCATFTTRGCPNACPFCAVPILEGDLREIKDFRPAPVVCDNNLLASSKAHIRRVVDSLKQFPFVDFNQGLDCDLFTSEIADMLGELNCRVRFAFDDWDRQTAVQAAIKLCRERTTNDIRIYCLVGFNDNPTDAKARLELVRSWGIRPTPMRFQPLDAKVKNESRGLAPSWTDWEMKKMIKYYSRLVWYEAIPYEDFKWLEDQQNQGALL